MAAPHLLQLVAVICTFSYARALDECPRGKTWSVDEPCCDTKNPSPETSCFQTVTCPRKSNYLQFCRWYNQGNDGACCIPGHDADNQDMFENLIDGLGPGCKNPMMYPQIRAFYCLGCDPRQPEYVYDPTPPLNYQREEYCYPGICNTTELDDRLSQTNPKLVGEEAGQPAIRICKEFADQMWACENPSECDGPDGTHYDVCGVMISNPCYAYAGNGGDGEDYETTDQIIHEFADFDPYQCGDDLVIPSKSFSDVTEFMATFAPPNLDYFQYVVCDTDGMCYEGNPNAPNPKKTQDYCRELGKCPCFNGGDELSVGSRFESSALIAIASVLVTVAAALTIH